MGVRLIIGLVVFAGIGIVGLFNSSKAVDDLAVGDCIADPGDAVEIMTIDTIDCDDPHSGEVFYNGQIFGYDTFPGDDGVYDAAAEQCYRQFPSYVGTPYEQSEFYFTVFTPTRTGWDDGDRGFSCVIVPEFGTLDGSVRGSNR